MNDHTSINRNMTRTSTFLAAMISLMLTIGCKPSSDYCTVKGIAKGYQDGTKFELQDYWHGCKVVGTAVVKDGAFEIHPNVSAPTHVFLYQDDLQLQDFFLEPGTILVNMDAAVGEDYGPGVTGTPSNDTLDEYRVLKKEGREDAMQALVDSVFAAKQTGPLVVTCVDGGFKPAGEALDALKRLSPELSDLRFVKNLMEEMSLLAKTEPTADYKPHFLDLEYADLSGEIIRLSSVVNNPQNRYVLLDFWATWCGPCIRYLPQMKQVYAKYHGKGLEIVSVSIDSSEKKWRSFMEENGVEWISVLDDLGGKRTSKVWENYAISVIPMFLLIDGNTGEILFRENQPDLDAIFSELLP